MPTMVLPAPQGRTMTPRAAADVAAGVEDVGRLALVVADVERQPASRRPSRSVDRQRRPFGVAGQVLGRVADGDQRLLQHAAEGRLDGEARRRRAARRGTRATFVCRASSSSSGLSAQTSRSLSVDAVRAGPGRSG